MRVAELLGGSVKFPIELVRPQLERSSREDSDRTFDRINRIFGGGIEMGHSLGTYFTSRPDGASEIACAQGKVFLRSEFMPWDRPLFRCDCSISC